MPLRPKRPKRKILPLVDDFVRVSRAGLSTVQNYIIRLGTAIVGGDFTGEARGLNAIDITTKRLAGASGKTQVASGDYSVQFGALNTVSSDYGVRIGYTGLVEGEAGVGIGRNANVDGENGVAIGLNSYAGGADSVAIGGANIFTDGGVGVGVTARLVNAERAFVTGVGAAIKRGAGLAAEANWPVHLGGALAVYSTGRVDLKTATFHTLALPDGLHFFPVAMGLWVTAWDTVTVQPTIAFGVTFDDDKYVEDRQTIELTAVGKREHYLPESLADYETDLNFTVVVGATATSMLARLYWIGLLLEDE